MRRHEREHRNGNGSPRTLLKGPLPTSPSDGTEGFGWTSAALCSQQVFLDETQITVGSQTRCGTVDA